MKIFVATESDAIAAGMLKGLGELGHRAHAILRERHLITRLRDSFAQMLFIDVNFGGEGEGEASARLAKQTLGIPVVCMVSGCDARRRRHQDGIYYMPILTDVTALRCIIGLDRGARSRSVDMEAAADADFQPETSEHCSIETDRSGLITRMNTAAGRVTGWRPVEAVGTPVAVVFRTAPSLRPNQNVLIARDGSARAIEGDAVSLLDDSGAFSGMLMRFRACEDRPAEALFPPVCGVAEEAACAC